MENGDEKEKEDLELRADEIMGIGSAEKLDEGARWIGGSIRGIGSRSL